jgi:hypothetical protein
MNRAGCPHLGTKVDEGRVKMWGGDVGAKLDSTVSYGTRLYFLAGGGWYDEQNSFRYQSTLVRRNTTGTHFAKNGGLGVEFFERRGYLLLHRCPAHAASR